MREVVPVEIIVRLVKLAGSDALVEGDSLKLYPKGGDPRVYPIPEGGFSGRLVIEIAQRTGVPSHHFWHPERAEAAAKESVERKPTIPPGPPN